jgi:hypothetical protein
MRVEDDPHRPGYPGPRDEVPAPPPPDDDSSSHPGSAAHAGWAPPEYYTPSGERRTDAGLEGEPPGPVATDGPYDAGTGEQRAEGTPAEGTPADATRAEGTRAEEAALDDVDGGEFPPDNYLAEEDRVREPGGDGTRYGHPAAEAGQQPVDEMVTEQEPAHFERAYVQPDQAAAAAAAAGQPVASPGQAEQEPQPGQEDRLQAEGLAPGEVPVEPVGGFWEAETVDGFRDRWQQIQLRFIDDPRVSAEQAQTLVTDVIQGFAQALASRREELDRWREAQLDDTEELRVTVRRYRDFLDRLFAL